MSFRTKYPFDFSLLNSKDENVFYLEDKVEGVTLEFLNQCGEQVLFKPAQVQPDNRDYHLALKFRPGVLNADKQPAQKIGLWTVSEAVVDADGCATLYFTHAGSKPNPSMTTPLACDPGKSVKVKFQLNVSGNKGSRATNVELKANNVRSKSIDLKNSVRQINWTLINHRGKSGLPLQLSFKDSDTILNDGTKNELSFRVSNIQKTNPDGDSFIQFNNDPAAGPLSRISIFFDPGESSSASTLGSDGNINAIIMDELIPAGGIRHFKGDKAGTQNELTVWTFKLDATITNFMLFPHITGDNTLKISRTLLSINHPSKGTFIDFKMSDIVTKYISGKTKVHVRFENIPGYWDETFSLDIDKQPLVFRQLNGEQNTGVRTKDPLIHLDVQGMMGIKGGGNWDHLYFQHDGDSAYMTAGGANKGLVLRVANGDTGSYGNQNYVEAMRLLSNGNVGVGTSPLINLDVKGMMGLQGGANWDHLYFQHDGSSAYMTAGGAETGLVLRVGQGAGSYGSQEYTEGIRVMPNGNVGINHSSPDAKLQVNGDVKCQTLYLNSSHLVYNSQNAVIDWGSQSSGNLYFRTLSSQGNVGGYKDLAVITSAGRMGVNNTDPQLTLDVVGNFGIRNGAAWDHMYFEHDGATAHIKAGGAESGLALRVGNGSASYGGQSYTEVMRLLPNGNTQINGRLGIGTGSPGFPIDVKGFANTFMGRGFWFLMQEFGCRTSGSDYNNSVSIKVEWAMYSQAYYCYSDLRIKDEIVQADTLTDLERLRNLTVVDYYYKDFISNGSNKNKGFIAQEVEKIFPDAVSKAKDFIPDIYAIAAETSLINGVLTVSMIKEHLLIAEDRVRIITEDNSYREVEVRVVDEKTFVVENWTDSKDRLFVYGKEVDDFRTLDYDHIFCAGISAIQEMSKQVDALNEKLQKQEARLQKLEMLLDKQVV